MNINIFKDDNIDLKKSIKLLIIIMIFSGVLGFIYEEIYFFIKLGYFVKRGSTFGPIIPIYVFGGGLISLTYKYRKHPIFIFIINSILCGSLELISAFVLDKVFDTRLWDYSKEFLNIGGYVCLTSILSFGVGSLFIMYVLIPVVKKICLKISDTYLTIISYSLGLIFIIDMVSYMLLK